MRRWLTITACLIPLLLSGPGTAKEGWRAYRKGRKPIPASQAVEQARGLHEGTVLSTEFVRTGEGKGYYRIKMVENGKVRIVKVDAYPGN